MSGERTKRTGSTGVTQYEYDGLSHLRTVTLPAQNGTHPVIQYEYDQLGRRISRSMTGPDSEPTRKWVYRDGLRIAAEQDASDNITSRFVYSTGRMPVQMIRGNTVYLLVTDYLGSLRAVVRLSDGEIMQSMEYDEFGRVIADEVVNGFERVPFGYAGGLYDRGTGLVRFGARDYDPETGRWTSKDATRFDGGNNLYGYAKGDPNNWVDLTGENPLIPAAAACWLTGACEAAGAAASAAAVTAGVAVAAGVGYCLSEIIDLVRGKKGTKAVPLTRVPPANDTRCPLLSEREVLQGGVIERECKYDCGQYGGIVQTYSLDWTIPCNPWYP